MHLIQEKKKKKKKPEINQEGLGQGFVIAFFNYVNGCVVAVNQWNLVDCNEVVKERQDWHN